MWNLRRVQHKKNHCGENNIQVNIVFFSRREEGVAILIKAMSSQNVISGEAHQHGEVVFLETGRKSVFMLLLSL